MTFTQLVEKLRVMRDSSPEESGEYIANDYLYSQLGGYAHLTLTEQRHRVGYLLTMLKGQGGVNACREHVRLAYYGPMGDMQAWLLRTHTGEYLERKREW